MTETDFRGTVFSGCTISDKLGQGGMGTVYKARHEALDKIVCVKLLSPELARDQRNIDFFLREARSAAKLEHPNIVHIYNFGQENGSYFIVMSYVEGKSLQDLVEQRGPLPVPEATGLMAGILDGLAHAHSKSIIHRDIKPSNILVDSAGIPHIVDFGLARSLNEEKQLTIAGEMIGTAYFMSPEQCLSGKVDNRADLYSAGATYFHILTGKYPFDGKTSIEVIHKHISEPAPNPLLINPDIPLWAARVIERLMRKKPEERYQKAEDVALELRKYNSGELNVSQTSTEKTFDMPELTARILAASMQPPPPPGNKPLEMAGPLPVDNTSDETSPIKSQTLEQKKEQPAPVRKPAMQLAMLHNAVKTLTHFALTLGAVGCFILAGASGTISGSLSNPLASNPIVTGIFAVFGLALFAWALSMKPLKFTPLYTLLALAAAAAAYAGGAYIPAPEGADTATKGFLAVTIGMANIASDTATLIYAFFLYLAASKIVFRANVFAKLLAIAAYIGGLALTYVYFKAGLPATPADSWLAAAGVLAAAGLAAAIVQREFSLFFNPPFFFLAANLMIFSMFTNPQVEIITQEKVRSDAETVNLANARNREDYHHALAAAQAEVVYDVDGRPVEKKPAPPQEIKQAETNTLRSQARLEYYTALSKKLNAALAESAGIVFIALFLALMINICFIEELLAVYRETEFF
ncbi:MAG: hypothetical protein A2234_11540 [Elusimicrobia bacterium RIFOXYA2_FULL_58_8]|nr:MAG: hypothetical protein A2234_11540 [Elusimicrobia bacterium RIFOXYA2_FULL_58_8]